MFAVFKQAVADQFKKMKDHQLFRTDVEKELMWLTYLESFPEGTNPMFRERREYDCQSCKSFIRTVGSMVAIINGEMVSLWDCEVEYPYNVVAKELSSLVKSESIRNIFLHDCPGVGVDKNYQETDNGILTWEHFHLVLPDKYVSQDRGSVYADKQSQHDVFVRALEEIKPEAIDTVIELIDQGSLYRGEEHLDLVKMFGEQKKAFDELPLNRQREFFVWRQDISSALARIRNSAIGTLLVDLSDGHSLDEAVRMFESKVAPQNYKRPKAIVTKAMVTRARQSVEKLGYTSALGRRFAVPEDIAITDVLFANRDARKAMNADVFDEIISETRDNPKSLEKVEKVPIETFVETILPKATSIELLFENRHAGNLVNLVAPQDPGSKLLFKWNNNFSWAYAGDLADSIKARVKAQGGSVVGDFRASLAWFNSDDLDLHLKEPNGDEICYSWKHSWLTDGKLDVDMNVDESGPNASRNAVENITYPEQSKMLEGCYHLFVNNFTHRERKDVGFEVELEFGGETIQFAYDQEVKKKQNVTVVKFEFSQKDGLKINESLPRRNISKELWGLSTQRWHPVTMAMLSPNYWGARSTGNKHYFFVLQDCQREGSSRGFFNEYLRNDLHEHRKVFEILGSKMRTRETGEQLSGLGFSSTRRDHVYAKVAGSFTRTIDIVF